MLWECGSLSLPSIFQAVVRKYGWSSACSFQKQWTYWATPGELTFFAGARGIVEPCKVSVPPTCCL